MQTSDLDYDLPADAIAQRPLEPRDSARMLVATSRALAHETVADLHHQIEPGDVVVLNDTKVIPARLHLYKPTGGAVEVLLLERRADGTWEALVKPSRRIADATVLSSKPPGSHDDTVSLRVEVGPALGDGRRLVRLVHADARTDDDWLDRVGEVPLPPYIHEPLADPNRYQTVFAKHPGSVAAPTAGLHLTEALLQRLADRGATIVRVELVVGLATFRPITVDRVEDHPMHAEHYRIPAETIAVLERRRSDSGGPRVTAIGTTAVRAVESWAASGRAEGDTSLFIHGDYPFAVVDRLLTNFHVPRSSLLALVQSFVGPGWRDLYEAALLEKYRFLSFGDAMLLDRGACTPSGSTAARPTSADAARNETGHDDSLGSP